MGKGAFIKRMDSCSQKLHTTNIIMGKTEREEGRAKDNEFSGVK